MVSSIYLSVTSDAIYRSPWLSVMSVSRQALGLVYPSWQSPLLTSTSDVEINLLFSRKMS